MTKKGKERADISYNDFLPYLWREAITRDMQKQDFLLKAGFAKQRYSDWKSRRQNLSGRVFIKLMDVLNLSCEDLEKLSGKKFSEEQRKELTTHYFIMKYPDIVDLLVKNPNIIKSLRNSEVMNILNDETPEAIKILQEIYSK